MGRIRETATWSSFGIACLQDPLEPKDPNAIDGTRA